MRGGRHGEAGSDRDRLLLTTSLSGGEWAVVIGLSWLAPAVVAVDKAVQLRRLDRRAQASAAVTRG
jgi:hypothetical protein